jgi:hypothetical protein
VEGDVRSSDLCANYSSTQVLTDRAGGVPGRLHCGRDEGLQGENGPRLEPRDRLQQNHSRRLHQQSAFPRGAVHREALLPLLDLDVKLAIGTDSRVRGFDVRTLQTGVSLAAFSAVQKLRASRDSSEEQGRPNLQP